MRRDDDEIPPREDDDNGPGNLAWRSLILPALASTLLAVGVGIGVECARGPGTWLLLAAPALGAIGAVGGPERGMRQRLQLALLSTAINLVLMVLLGMVFGWTVCGVKTH